MKKAKKGFSRKRAKVSLVLSCLGIVLVLLTLLTGRIALGWCGVGCLAAAFLVLEHRCPYCGGLFFRAVAPLWSKPGELHCMYCDKRLAYDDEPEET